MFSALIKASLFSAPIKPTLFLALLEASHSPHSQVSLVKKPKWVEEFLDPNDRVRKRPNKSEEKGRGSTLKTREDDDFMQ